MCLRGHSLLCTQIVQRSLSGGFLVQDRALLAANARSMFDEAIDTTCFVGEGRPTAQGGSIAKRSAREPAVSCGAVESLPSGLFTKRVQVLVVAAAGNSNTNPCATYYGGSGVR